MSVALRRLVAGASRRRSRILALVVGVGVTYACLNDSPTGPAHRAESSASVVLRAQVAGAPDATLVVRILYQRDGDGREDVTLDSVLVPVEGGARPVRMTVDLADCYADALRSVPGPDCEIIPRITLLDVDGAELDDKRLPAILVHPGVTVTPDPVVLAAVGSVVPDTPLPDRLREDDTVAVSVKVKDRNGGDIPDRKVIWTSDNGDVLTVSCDGTEYTTVCEGSLTARVATGAPGSGTVTATAGSQRATLSVTIDRRPTQIGVSPNPADVVVGATVTLQPAVTDKRGEPVSGFTIAWESDDPGIASVDPSSGIVSGLAPGSTSITASIEELALSSEPVPVTVRADTILVSPNRASVVVDGTVTLSASVRDANGNQIDGVDVTWSSADPDIATVDAATGVVTGRSQGSARIIAEGAGASGAAQVEVIPSVIEIEITADVALTLVPGNLTSLTATVRGVTGAPLSGRTVTWTSQNPAVATLATPATGTSNEAGRHTVRISALSAGSTQVVATSEGRSDAVAVTVEVAYVAISAGALHTCGITTSGDAYCWGRNDAGQLGDGTRTDRRVPTIVTGRLKFSAISAGRSHTCAITTDRIAFCWGLNDFGQLGIGSRSGPQPQPQRVQSDVPLDSISAGGSHTCALRGDTEEAFCWGAGANGRLGYGGTEDRPSPVQVVGPLFKAISAGLVHTCGLSDTEASGGFPHCWGANAPLARLGFDSDGLDVTTPVGVADAQQLTAIDVAFSGDHTCGVTVESGTLLCWGRNNAGQLGTGDTQDRLFPAEITSQGDILNVTTGELHSCAIQGESGIAFCWGSNSSGQLGTGDTRDRLAPEPLSGGSRSFFELVAGGRHTCGFASEDGLLYCWGQNDAGQLGVAPGDGPVVAPQLVLFQHRFEIELSGRGSAAARRRP